MNFLTATTGAVDLVNISIANAGIVALLGYAVVFFGLILLMCVITILGKAFQAAEAKAKAAAAAAPAAVACNTKAQAVTNATLSRVEKAMRIDYFADRRIIKEWEKQLKAAKL